jgi:hypothetical protein
VNGYSPLPRVPTVMVVLVITQFQAACFFTKPCGSMTNFFAAPLSKSL